MACETDSETYLSLLDDNHWMMVKTVDPEVFLDYMRQHSVLSEEDCQTIQNYFVYQSRRARMRCFLDILRTKGPDNIRLYFKQLGWEYPHVYREIFRREPDPPPHSYTQDTKSRMSCNLNHLLTVGLDMKRVRDQKENLADQIKDMEAMLKHQKNEIEDLEREHQRLRKFERDNQQMQERLHTVTAKNEEIKEENRQFLHEIRTLTLEVQKRREMETKLQTQLDEMTQQIQVKSFELHRKSKEESDLRAKFERVRKQSLRFQSRGQPQNRIPNLVEQIVTSQHTARQEDLKQQIEILMDDMKNMEETNRSLCDKLQYMQDLLDEEKNECDQMHRQVCALEHDKNTMESRQNMSLQKIERYFRRIQELEEQKRKLEEERMHMQTKIWEMSRDSEKQFEQLHKVETRYDELQQHYEQFRQDHRYCERGVPFEQRRQHLPDTKARPTPFIQLGHSPGASPASRKEDPFEPFTSFYTCNPAVHPAPSTETSSSPTDAPDGDIPLSVCNPIQSGNLNMTDRSCSMKVNLSTSMREKSSQDMEDCVEDDETASTVSELSSVSSSAFDPVSSTDTGIDQTDDVKCTTSPHVTGDSAVTGNFFIRSNVKEEGDAESPDFVVQEGDILYVDLKEQDSWKVTKVDRATGQMLSNLQGSIASLDSRSDNMTGQLIQRKPSCENIGNANCLSRANAIRRDILRRQQSYVAAYTTVYPMKAVRLLPVLVLCPQSAMKSVLSCMEVTAKDWAEVISDGHIDSAAQLHAKALKHFVLPWEIRPKEPQRCGVYLHTFIIIIITLESCDALPTLRYLLGDPDLCMDFDQEMKLLKERQEIVQRVGLHAATVTVKAGQDNREAFWDEVRDKVSQIQQQVFWLEKNPHHTEDAH